MSSPFDKALALHRQGDLAGAVQAYDQAIGLQPDHVEALLNRGAALRGLGRAQEALASCDAALAVRPGQAPAHYNRGNALMDLGRCDEALASFEAVIAAGGPSAEALNGRANALLRLGRPEAAAESLDAALALRPDYATAQFNRGVALLALKRPEAALESFDAAIALQPGYADAHNGRGSARLELFRFEAALESFDDAIALRPGDPRFHANRSKALLQLGRATDALAACDAALALAPDDAGARFNRALALLTLGRFAEGWRDYERRWDAEGFVGVASGEVTPALRARFDPDVTVEDLAGRRVLLVAEQGVGDVIMFASIIPDLARVAGHVTLLCERRLQRLFAHSFPQVTVLDPRAADFRMPEADRVLALGGLARLFRNRPEDFPGRPYLAPRDDERWRERLGPKGARLRVGLSWRGGSARTGSGARSVSLADLRPLLDLPDCEFVSLQYGDPGAEVASANAGLQRPIRLFAPDEIDDFADLAGLVRALDVVVSVQTALVHLSGALGAPCLVMVPKAPEWRYAADAPTMPWYGSVSLFRQDRTGAWGPVIAQVAERLARWP